MTVINTNTTSMVAQQNLNRANNALSTTMERLSSGLRINSAKDDAAGQAISNRMTAQIKGMEQAARNANDGISVAQTAEGGLDQINSNLLRIRELAEQAANDTNSEKDRASIQEEISARIDEIDRVASSSHFNGINLLDGSKTELNIQVGANTTTHDSLKITLTNAKASELIVNEDGDAIDLKVDAVDTFENAQKTIDAIDGALEKVDEARSSLGSIQNRFSSVIDNLHSNSLNLSAARSRIQDADYATEVSNMTKTQIVQQAGTTVLAQANQMPQAVLSLLR